MLNGKGKKVECSLEWNLVNYNLTEQNTLEHYLIAITTQKIIINFNKKLGYHRGRVRSPP